VQSEDVERGFETAIAMSDETVKVREPLPPWEVAQAMGYSVPGSRELLTSKSA